MCECERLPHKQVNSKAQGSVLTGGARERDRGREREREKEGEGETERRESEEEEDKSPRGVSV